MNKFDYKYLTPFKWFILENFPFIEADFDALTEWQLFCKLGKEINKIINSENILGTQMENVTNAFIELQDYVNNYFDNLDVQDEVNNKLNEMAESGELVNIIAQYLQVGAVLTYNTIADMVASTSLVEGSVVRCLGRTTFNDMKGATYKIVVLQSHVADGINTISLGHDDLYAQLIYENKILVIDTLQNLKTATNISKYDYYKTLGYNSINDGGQGLYYIVDELESGESANNGNIVALQNGLYAKLVIENIINIKQFGAVGDNETDDTTAIQNAINYSANNYYKKIFIPEGVYKITSIISTPQAFNQPIISGENTENCIFNFSTSTEDCIKIKGGSGRLARSYMENITFIGNNSVDKSCIVLADVCGYDIKNCIFKECRRGIMFYNENQNAFTEYCVAKNCSFESSCHIAIEYLRGNGTDSFHGSGLMNCTINQAETETYYKIIINNNCIVYNAPLDFACWKYNTSLALINNLSVTNNMRQTFYGNMKLELKNTNNQYILKEGDGNIYYCGYVTVLSSSAILDNIVFCEKVEINSDRSLAIQRKPWKQTISVTSNSQNILYVSDFESYIVQMRIWTSNYEYQYTLLVNGKKATTSVAITTLMTGETFNQAGYGAPTFDSDGRNLRINNNNYSAHNVNVAMNITPLRMAL